MLHVLTLFDLSFLVLNQFDLLFRLSHLLLRLLVLLAVNCLSQGSCLDVVVVKMDRLCVQEAIGVQLGLLKELLCTFFSVVHSFCVRRRLRGF